MPLETLTTLSGPSTLSVAPLEENQSSLQLTDAPLRTVVVKGQSRDSFPTERLAPSSISRPPASFVMTPSHDPPVRLAPAPLTMSLALPRSSVGQSRLAAPVTEIVVIPGPYSSPTK